MKKLNSSWLARTFARPPPAGSFQVVQAVATGYQSELDELTAKVHEVQSNQKEMENYHPSIQGYVKVTPVSSLVYELPPEIQTLGSWQMFKKEGQAYYQRQATIAGSAGRTVYERALAQRKKAVWIEKNDAFSTIVDNLIAALPAQRL